MDTVTSIQNGTVRSTGKAGPINCTATVRIRKSGGEKQSFHIKKLVSQLAIAILLRTMLAGSGPHRVVNLSV